MCVFVRCVCQMSGLVFRERETLHSSPTLTSLPVSTEENSRRTAQDTHQDKRLTSGREKLRCRNLAASTLHSFSPPKNSSSHKFIALLEDITDSLAIKTLGVILPKRTR